VIYITQSKIQFIKYKILFCWNDNW